MLWLKKKNVNFKHNLGIDILSIQVNITLEWMPEDLIDEKLTCHYLNRYWRH